MNQFSKDREGRGNGFAVLCLYTFAVKEYILPSLMACNICLTKALREPVRFSYSIYGPARYGSLQPVPPQ